MRRTPGGRARARRRRDQPAQLDLEARPSASDAPLVERELALAALAALRLDFGCVHVADGAVAHVSAAPDLDAWDLASEGRVARALAALLTSPRTALVNP